MPRALVLALALLLLAAPVAEAQSRQRPRIIWDVPPDKVIRIATIAPGQSVRVVVPFHTTGDLARAEATVWTRGVIAALIGSQVVGPVSAFTPRELVILVGAPLRREPGPYAMTVQIADRGTNARDIFRTTVLVEGAVQSAPVAPVATATPRPRPTAVPTATPTPRRPVLGWGRYLSGARVTPRSGAAVSGAPGTTRGAGFVRS